MPRRRRLRAYATSTSTSTTSNTVATTPTTRRPDNANRTYSRKASSSKLNETVSICEYRLEPFFFIAPCIRVGFSHPLVWHKPYQFHGVSRAEPNHEYYAESITVLWLALPGRVGAESQNERFELYFARVLSMSPSLTPFALGCRCARRILAQSSLRMSLRPLDPHVKRLPR